MAKKPIEVRDIVLDTKFTEPDDYAHLLFAAIKAGNDIDVGKDLESTINDSRDPDLYGSSQPFGFTHSLERKMAISKQASGAFSRLIESKIEKRTNSNSSRGM